MATAHAANKGAGQANDRRKNAPDDHRRTGPDDHRRTDPDDHRRTGQATYPSENISGPVEAAHTIDWIALMKAVKGGNLAVVKELVQRNVDVNDHNSQGQTPTLIAFSCGHTDIGAFLHETKATNLEHSDVYGVTALIYASTYDHRQTVEYLVGKGVNINHQSNDGQTAVMTAFGSGHTEVGQYLLEHGATGLDACDRLGQTALMHASRSGNLDSVKYLVETGGLDVNHECHQSWTPLLWACSSVHTKSGKHATTGGNQHIKQVRDQSIKRLKVVDYLRKAGADINHQNNQKQSALLLAIQNGYADPSRHLVEHGADVNLSDKTGETPLMAAVKHGETEIVRYLLEKDVDMTSKHPSQQTVLELALERGYTEIGNILRRARQPKDHTVHDGRGETEAEEKMLEKKATKEIANIISEKVESSGKETKNALCQMQAKLANLATNDRQSQDQIKELSKTVKELGENLSVQMRDVQSGMTLLIKKTDEYKVSLCQTNDFNELVFYKIGHLIASHVARVEGHWKDLCDNLFLNYPESVLSDMKKSIDKTDSSEAFKAYEVIVRWKVIVATYPNKETALKRAVEMMNLVEYKEIVAEIDDLINKHSYRKYKASADILSDKNLGAIGKNIGTEWKEIGLNLDIPNPRLVHLEEDNNKNSISRNTAMLIEWRNREEGFTAIKVARLCEALKRAGRVDIAQTLHIGELLASDDE